MRNRFWLALGVGFLVAGLAGGAAVLQSRDRPATASCNDPPVIRRQRIVCSGRVEAVGGEVQVFAQISGRLAEVLVRDGDLVSLGQPLAVMEGTRTQADVQIAAANVQVAQAALDRLVAGAGDEEKSQALCAVQACQAELAFARASLERLRPLVEKKIRSVEELELAEQQVAQLTHRADGLIEQHKALTRPVREADLKAAQANLELARAQLARANVEHGYTVIPAPQAGVVLKVLRHRGDSVSTSAPTPVVLLANTDHLQVRLEMDEADVPHIAEQMQGVFEIRGLAGEEGRLRLERVIPVFGPKRLFSPDTSLGHDTRMLEVLCRVEHSPAPLHLGQRVTARFELPHRSKPLAGKRPSAT